MGEDSGSGGGGERVGEKMCGAGALVLAGREGGMGSQG